MTCDEAGLLLHALIDNELDAGHARDIEAHAAGCPRCSARLREYRAMHQALSAAALRQEAPAHLRRRIEQALPAPRAAGPNRRGLLKGFATGTALSAAMAASVLVFVTRGAEEQRVLGEIVSAHLRSLQAEHLTDVVSSDQHTVKPWFNGRLDVAPPVVDLTAQGFTLIGGRLDYLDGRPMAAIVYRRRTHVINLFVAQAAGFDRGAKVEKIQGFNIRRWSSSDLNFWAVSDINAEELQEFGDKFEAALRASGG